MRDKKIALIGGGQMGRALVGGMIDSGIVTAAELSLVEPSEAGRQWWVQHHAEIAITDLNPAVAEADLVLVAVKPNVVPIVAGQQPHLWQGKLIVSIAAGLGLERLTRLFGHPRVVRVMPNTPCLVGAGASAFCVGSEVTASDRQWVESLLAAVGQVVEVDESQMDAVTGLSGSGPAYVCIFIEALADGGVQAGLPRPLAMKLATQTVLGTAHMIASSNRHPAELKDAVASPGGTTIAGIAVLEQNGVRGAVAGAVVASADRARQLGSRD
jgi:pyrroline-5-carboxylate reductase